MNANVTMVSMTLILTMMCYWAWDRYQRAQEYARVQQTSIQAIQAIRDVLLSDSRHKQKSD